MGRSPKYKSLFVYLETKGTIKGGQREEINAFNKLIAIKLLSCIKREPSECTKHCTMVHGKKKNQCTNLQSLLCMTLRGRRLV